MSNYEYSSFSSSSSNNGAAGFDVAKAMFNQADTNRDGGIDRNEFKQWASSIGGGAAQYDLNATGGAAGGYDSTSYDSANFSADVGAGAPSFESSIGGVGSSESNFESSSTVGGGFDVTTVNQAASYTAETNAAWSRYGAEVTGAGLFVDSNPQIIRRAATGGVQTYTQNIKIRFLQPPPVPPPGPLIIKEVRPPQPPPPPPLRIKQQAPPLPQPPPLVLRERPPQPPAQTAAQTVVRNLPALPVPPRSVIIERIPAAPARPRDIIIERWVPYGAAAKRKTIVQRAESAKDYPTPRNVIIQYEPIQVRVIRQFQRLGVTQANPQAYLQQYGAQLLDAQSLVQQARAAGVVEDISPPAAAASSSSFSQEGSGVEFGGDVAGGAPSSFTSSSFEGSQVGGVTGFESGLAEGTGGGYTSSNFEASSSFSSSAGGGASGGFGVDGNLAGGYSSSSYESSNYGGSNSGAGFDVVAAAFNSADKNRDGSVDASEFKQFYQGGL